MPNSGAKGLIFTFLNRKLEDKISAPNIDTVTLKLD
jgi:hypothetical protein